MPLAPLAPTAGAQVMLVQGLTAAMREDVFRGPHHAQDGGLHLLNALKFVAARFSREQGDKRGVLGALGGAWDPELDGGEPQRCGTVRRGARGCVWWGGGRAGMGGAGLCGCGTRAPVATPGHLVCGQQSHTFMEPRRDSRWFVRPDPPWRQRTSVH